MAPLARRLAALACVVGFACTSPTLPLPPPTEPAVTLSAQAGMVHLSSVQGAQPDALIVVVNQNVDLPRNQRVSGTIADVNGSWDLDVVAKTGDRLDISQESGTTRSPTTSITVR